MGKSDTKRYASKGGKKGTVNKGSKVKNQAMPRTKKNVPTSAVHKDFKPTKKF